MVWLGSAGHSLFPKRYQSVWALGLLLLISLRDAGPGNPQAAYDQTRQLFLHGYLETSQLESEQNYLRFRDSNPEWALKFQLLEAEAMVWRGMFDDSLRILATQSPTLNNADDTIRRLTVEGMDFTRLQRFPEAYQRLTKAESICAVAMYAACGGVLRAHGVLALEQGDLAKAREMSFESLAFARSHHDRWLEITAIQNLGAAALQDEHYDEALEWSRSAYKTAVELGGNDLAQRASGNLGWAYFGLGDSERALGLLLEAEKRAKDLGDLRAQLNWLKNAAYVYRDYGELKQAQETFRKALDLATQINSKKDIIDTLEDLAHVSVETGNLDAASAYISRVAPLVRASGNSLDISYVSLAQGKLAAARREDAQAETLFRAVERDPASQVSMRFGAEHELARLYEAEGRMADAGSMYKTALATFEGARKELKDDDSKLPFLANATRIYDDYIHFLVAQGKTEEALMKADQSRARTLAQGLGAAENQKALCAEATSPRAVARKADATLLFYWLGAQQSYLWAITPEKIVMFPLPAQREITPLVERYRKALLGSQDPLESGNAAGQQLYTMLVAPASKLIRANAPVMVLADGALSELNFETLIVPEKTPTQAADSPANDWAHYWIEDANVMSAPSLAMLAIAKPWRETARSLLLLGDPVSPAEDYPELPFASMEMHKIEGHFKERDETVFTRGEATPAAYLANDPKRFSYIHFVSHGIASRTDPLDSAIILSRAAQGGASQASSAEDSFKLYAREVMQHPIDARLVTVSACYGSGSRAFAGEGLVGLSWAFLRAGAHNVIGALWEASDESSPRLMDALYQGLQEGKSPETALRNAKLALLHSSSKFHKAYYWAPYQIYTRL